MRYTENENQNGQLYTTSSLLTEHTGMEGVLKDGRPEKFGGLAAEATVDRSTTATPWLRPLNIIWALGASQVHPAMTLQAHPIACEVFLLSLRKKKRPVCHLCNFYCVCHLCSALRGIV